MRDGTLRHVLMTGTHDLHQTLDHGIGAFDDARSYATYLSGSHAFRAAVEPQVIGDGDWRIQPLVSLIAQDMADLGVVAQGPTTPIPLTTPAARAAACYVLEGSALGGRILARRAAGLGFTDRHGARHLAAQTASPARWRQFLEWLEAGGFCAATAIAAARDVFAVALRSYGVRTAA